MASFAQEQPNAQEPNFAFWAKPIAQPRPNLTGEAIAKGLTAVTGVAVEGADFLAKRDIDNRVHSGLDKAVREETSRLDTVEDSLFGKDDSPIGKHLDRRMASIHQALGERANGTIDEALYYANRDQVAKDVRAQYPGYRDYIDQRVARYTHQDPANLVIRQRMAELNSFIKQNKEDDKFLRHQLIDAGMAHVWQGVENGTTTRSQAEQLLSDHHKEDVDYKRAVQKYTLGEHEYNLNVIRPFQEQQRAHEKETWDRQKRTDEFQEGVVRPFEEERMTKQREEWAYQGQKREVDERKLHAIDAISRHASEKTKQDLDQIFAASGFKDIDDLVSQGSKLSPQKWSEVSRALELRLDAAGIKLVQQAMTDFPGMDADTAKKVVDHAQAAARELIKHIGTEGGYAKAQYDEYKNQDNDIFRSMEGADPNNRNLRIIKEKYGQEFANIVGLKHLQGQMGDPKGLLGIRSNTVLNPAATLENEIEGVNKSNASQATKSKLYEGIINQVDMIDDLNNAGHHTEASDISKKIYGPSTANLLNKFKPGEDRVKIYSKVYSDSAIDSVWALKNKGHAEDWQNLGKSLTDSFHNMVGGEIDTLNRMPSGETNPKVRGALPPDYVTWDSEKHQLDFNSVSLPKTSRGKQLDTPAYKSLEGPVRNALQTKAAVDRLNRALDPVKHYAEKQGLDVNQYVVSTLLAVGLDPSSKGFTIPEQILRAVTTANQPKTKE